MGVAPAGENEGFFQVSLLNWYRKGVVEDCEKLCWERTPLVLQIFRFPNLFCFRPCVIPGQSNSVLSSYGQRGLSKSDRGLCKCRTWAQLRVRVGLGPYSAILMLPVTQGHPESNADIALWKQGLDPAQEIFWKIPSFLLSLRTAQGCRCLWLQWWLCTGGLFPLLNYVFSNADNCLFQIVQCNLKRGQFSIFFIHKSQVCPWNWTPQRNPAGRCSLTMLPMTVREWK